MMTTAPMSTFAKTIVDHKYAHTKPSGHKETWEEIAHRTVWSICEPYVEHKHIKKIERLVVERKFMPGGRFLYAAGRPYHQVNNCFLLRAYDSREGWGNLLDRVTNCLMSGGGVGVDYDSIREEGAPVKGLGGFCTGPLALMQIVNETGRHIMQGGSRRSAIWSRLRWSHPDIKKFVTLKDWPEWLRKQKSRDFNTPAPMDGTNISVGLDDEFFGAIADSTHPKHTLASEVFWMTTERMLKTAEPGFSIDVGINAYETLRNAPVAASTHVLTDRGYKKVGNIVNAECRVWTGKQWARTKFVCTGRNVPTVRVKMTGRREIVCDPSHPFILADGSRVAAEHLQPGDWLNVSTPQSHEIGSNDSEWYETGFVMGDGHIIQYVSDSFVSDRVNYDLTVCVDEKKPCVEKFAHRVAKGQESRGYDRYYGTLPCNELTKTGLLEKVTGLSWSDKASFLAGWFDADGSYDSTQHRIRLSGEYEHLQTARRILEELGILSGINKAGTSGYTGKQCWLLVVYGDFVNQFVDLVPTVRLLPDCYTPYRRTKIKVESVEPAESQDVFCCDVGVEEHSFMAEGVIISNCTEICSTDDNDVCNLASLVLPRFSSLEEYEEGVYYATMFLVCGSLYSDVPYDDVKVTRDKNRRLGLGNMGYHEWLLSRGKVYGEDGELAKWMEVYQKSTAFSHEIEDRMGVSRSVKTRAVAPNGTIGIVAETSTSAEPIFAVALLRRYLKGKKWHHQYVIDPVAQRLIDRGTDPDLIEDAYSLSEDVERRVRFQAWLQKYVDHGISSTINLPKWGSSVNNEHTVKNFGTMLLKYLPELRGITCYPDGARGGQPLNRVPYHEAREHVGKELVYETPEETCVGGVCGV